MFVQTVARILADTLKLDVTYSPSAGTFSIGKDQDGTLHLTMSQRMLAITHESEERVGALVRGALAHEALGHGYHTDFSPEAAAKRGAYAKSLANALEDVRIESLAPNRFIGARHILADMAKVVDLHGDWDADADPKAWQGNLLVALLRKFRTDVLHQPLRDAMTNLAIARARKALGDSLYNKVEALAAKACVAPDTATVSKYADAIVELLQKQAPQPSQQHAPSTAQNGDGSKSGSSKKQQPAQQPAFDPDSATDVTIEQAVSEACAQEASVRFNAAPVFDGTQAAEDRAKRAGGSGVSTAPGATQPQARAHVDPINGRLVNRIASRLDSALRSITEDGDDEETDVGRLDTTKLPGIVMGTEPFPFIADGSPAPGIDTELMLLVDASGSMDSLGARFLRELVSASLMALGRFAPGLSVSFATFSNWATLRAKPGCHVTPALAGAIASLYSPDSGTLWAASVATLVPVIAGSHRRRKVLLTITDGVLGTDTARRDVLADLDAQHIEHPFLSIKVPLPADCDGIETEATQEAFAKGFCQAIVSTLRPEFV
ncbi:MAG TPA: hypothetical protein VF292_03135 [Rhodanobacteraceae bacterium]